MKKKKVYVRNVFYLSPYLSHFMLHLSSLQPHALFFFSENTDSLLLGLYQIKCQLWEISVQ